MIIPCQRCGRKYVEDKDRLCDSCIDINPFTRQPDEEISKVYKDAVSWARDHGATCDGEGNWSV